MSTGSKIEWTETTWSPVTGCTRVSPGCRRCYAETLSARLANMGQEKYRGVVKTHATRKNKRGEPLALPQWSREVRTHEVVLLEPWEKWKSPTVVFVCSMSDLFHEDVPFEFIDRVFATMALFPQHTFQVLTKRSARMLEYFKHNPTGSLSGVTEARVGRWCMKIAEDRGENVTDPYWDVFFDWPLPNVWLGTSIEKQEYMHRAYDLARCPAAARFISAEPLLGPLRFDGLTIDIPWAGGLARGGRDYSPLLSMIDQVIVGGESGDDAKPMHPDWARSIRDQCERQNVEFFFKQWGAWRPGVSRDEYTESKPLTCVKPDGTTSWWAGDLGNETCINHSKNYEESDQPMERVGKKKAGRVLDGRTYDGMPRRKDQNVRS